MNHVDTTTCALPIPALHNAKHGATHPLQNGKHSRLYHYTPMPFLNNLLGSCPLTWGNPVVLQHGKVPTWNHMCKQLLQANILRQDSLFHEGSPLVTGSTVMVWVGGVMTGLPLSRAPTPLPLDKWYGVHSVHFHSVTTRHHEQVQEASC